MKTIEQEKHLTKKDLASRWGVTVRSVERTRKRFGLQPCGFFGRQPEFTVAAVEALEATRNKERIAMLAGNGNGHEIITVNEAKRRAGKRGAR
mgnify:CR=1 FL=1